MVPKTWRLSHQQIHQANLKPKLYNNAKKITPLPGPKSSTQPQQNQKHTSTPTTTQEGPKQPHSTSRNQLSTNALAIPTPDGRSPPKNNQSLRGHSRELWLY